MAASKSVNLLRGFTRFTGPSAIVGGFPVHQTGGIVLSDLAGNDWYIFVENDGTLKIADAVTAETAGFNTSTGGDVVGAQT